MSLVVILNEDQYHGCPEGSTSVIFLRLVVPSANDSHFSVSNWNRVYDLAWLILSRSVWGASGVPALF
jgi:hypothetical protein